MMMKQNHSLKRKLKKGEFIIGTWCDLPSPEAVNVLAKAGLDFVIVDMEHGQADFRLAGQMVMAAEADGSEAIIRVSQNNESETLRALDTGASGIIVPHIETVGEKDRAVTFSKFTPNGERGLNPYTRWAGYHAVAADFLKRENKNLLLGLIIEGKAGLENLDQIIADPNVDVIYIGTYDLSVALGVPGDVNNKLVINTLEHSVQTIRSAGKAVGSMIHNRDDLQKFKKLGIQFITYKTDTGILYDAFKSIIDEVKQ